MEIFREMKEILREKMEILREMKEIFRIEIYQIPLHQLHLWDRERS